MYTSVCIYTYMYIYMCSLLFSHSKVNVDPQLTPNICADLHVLDANKCCMFQSRRARTEAVADDSRHPHLCWHDKASV